MTKDEDEEEGGCMLCCEGMAQQTQQCPSDAGWFLMFRAWSGLGFLMLCNFEDGVFEVMHELHSFPASS